MVKKKLIKSSRAESVVSLLRKLFQSKPTAQAIELIHSIENAIEIISNLLTTRLEREKPVEVMTGPGIGAGAVEAPRGTLYHNYRFDEAGLLAEADVITPTAQNLANIEKDLRVTAQNLAGKPKGDLRSQLEMVVRAYDPCISCAVHVMEVDPRESRIPRRSNKHITR